MHSRTLRLTCRRFAMPMRPPLGIHPSIMHLSRFWGALQTGLEIEVARDEHK
jgi:hypothetical protein